MINSGFSSNAKNTPVPVASTASKPSSSSTGTLPRELMRWLQGLDLENSFKNLKRDFSNGYVIAEILSRYYPKEIHIPAYYSGSSSAAKKNNWEQLEKVLKKISGGESQNLAQKLRISKESVEKLTSGHEGTLLKFLLSLYEHVNQRKMLASTSQYGFSTSSLHGGGKFHGEVKQNGKPPSNKVQPSDNLNLKIDGSELQILKEMAKLLNVPGDVIWQSASQLFQWIDMSLSPEDVNSFFREMKSKSENPFTSSFDDLLFTTSSGLQNDIMSNSFQFAFEMTCHLLKMNLESDSTPIKAVFDSIYDSIDNHGSAIDDLLDKIPYIISIINIFRSSKNISGEAIFSLFREYPASFDCWVAFLLKVVESGEHDLISVEIILGTLEWIDSHSSILLSTDPTKFSTILLISVLLENREVFLDGYVAEESRLILHDLMTTHIDWRMLGKWTVTTLQSDKMTAIILYFMTMLIHTDPFSFAKIIVTTVTESNWYISNCRAFFLFVSTWPQLLENQSLLSAWISSLLEINHIDQDFFKDCLSCDTEMNDASFKSIQMDIASCICWTTNVPVKTFSNFIKMGKMQAVKVIESIEKAWRDDLIDRFSEGHLMILQEIFSFYPSECLPLIQHLEDFIILSLVNPENTCKAVNLVTSLKESFPKEFERMQPKISLIKDLVKEKGSQEQYLMLSNIQ